MILILTQLQSQQISLLGYIQLDGRTLYVNDKFYSSVYRERLTIEPIENATTMTATDINESVVYILTTDQKLAQRV